VSKFTGLMLHRAGQLDELLAAGLGPTLEQRLATNRDVTTTVRMCVDAVELAMRFSGGSGLFDHHPIQQAWRDVHGVAAHMGYNTDTVYGNWGCRCPPDSPDGRHYVSLTNQLAYIGAGATDLDAWRSYAGEVLGHQIMPETDDVEYVGWEVNNRAAMDRAASAVSDAGVEVVEGSPAEADLRGVLGFCHLVCPYSGVRMELAYGHEAMFAPAFAPSRPLSGFRTGDHGLGTVVFYPSDVQKASDF
jgi:hypothetical protein